MTLDNYPGAKSGSGIIQWLINHIPAHERYFELFAGSAQLFRAKRGAKDNILNDIDGDVIDQLRAELRPLPKSFGITPAGGYISYSNFDCIDFFKRRSFSGYTRKDFIYLDPPYPESARRNGRAYYKHEMLSDDDHTKLLSTIRDLPANVMISTRSNDLYDRMLHDWRKDTFLTTDRVGAVEEVIFMNYEVPELLHQYDYTGDGFSDRQRIKRKIDRFAAKFEALPPYERHLFIQQMISKDRAAVHHFLAMQPGSKDEAGYTVQHR